MHIWFYSSIRGTNFEPKKLLNPPAQRSLIWPCDITVKGNFKIKLEWIGVFKNKKIFELWENTFFMPNATEKDFRYLWREVLFNELFVGTWSWTSRDDIGMGLMRTFE